MSHPRRVGAAALAAAAVTITVALPAQAATHNAYGGAAYATNATIGGLVASGMTSYVPLCTFMAPDSATNNSAASDLPIGSVGAATTEVTSDKTSKTKTAEATTQVGATTLLGGAIEAQAITSTASVEKTADGYDTDHSSVFVGLKINGTTIEDSPEPNTEVDVPGIATIVLNSQSKSSSFGGHKAQTVAMRVTLLADNTLGLPVGTFSIGVANASLHDATHARPYGSAYGTQLDAAGVVGSGRTAYVTLPCGGTSGKTRTNSVSSVTAADLLQVGAVESTAKSTDSSSSTTATTASTLADVDLLGGIVTADAVKVKVTATRKDGKVSTSTSDTKVTGLKINGESVSVSAKENTEVDIPNVGTLYLRRVTKTKVSKTVYGAQLVLDTTTAGLPAGTTLNVGYAKAGVRTS